MYNWWRLFFHSERCLITCMMLPFAIQMCFSFTRSHLFISCWSSCLHQWVLLRKFFSVSVSSHIFATFSLSGSSKHILCWNPCSILIGEGAASRWECGAGKCIMGGVLSWWQSEDDFFILHSWRKERGCFIKSYKTTGPFPVLIVTFMANALPIKPHVKDK